MGKVFRRLVWSTLAATTLVAVLWGIRLGQSRGYWTAEVGVSFVFVGLAAAYLLSGVVLFANEASRSSRNPTR